MYKIFIAKILDYQASGESILLIFSKSNQAQVHPGNWVALIKIYFLLLSFFQDSSIVIIQRSISRIASISPPARLCPPRLITPHLPPDFDPWQKCLLMKIHNVPYDLTFLKSSVVIVWRTMTFSLHEHIYLKQKDWVFGVTPRSAPAYSRPSGRLVISQRDSRHKWKFAVTKHQPSLIVMGWL